MITHLNSDEAIDDQLINGNPRGIFEMSLCVYICVCVVRVFVRMSTDFFLLAGWRMHEAGAAKMVHCQV